MRVPEISIELPDSGEPDEHDHDDNGQSDSGRTFGEPVLATADGLEPGLADPEFSSLQEIIPLPRWVVYVQAALLGIVATTFFIFGLAVGSNTGTGGQADAASGEVQVGGTVMFQHDGTEQADIGAVILLLPVEGRLDPRPEPDTLIPSQFVPLDNPAIESIRESGGAVVRANRSGQFETRLRGGRSYWVLVLSNNKPADSRSIDKQLRADLGGYFFPVEDLLEQTAFHWQKIRLTGTTYRISRIVF